MLMRRRESSTRSLCALWCGDSVTSLIILNTLREFVAKPKAIDAVCIKGSAMAAAI